MKALIAAVLSVAVFVPQDSLAKRLEEAYAKATDWLTSQQDKGGAWTQGKEKAPSVAYTALIVAALGDAPASVKEKNKAVTAKGVEYLLSRQNADGSFGEGPAGAFLKVYSTSITLMALSLAAPDKKDAIGNARGYLKANQLKEGDNKGGLGYGDQEIDKEGKPKPTIPNLSTTGFAAEGMRRSGLPQDDDFWKLVVEYVSKCQNNSETNKDVAFVAKLKEKGLSIGDDGGLFYAADPNKSVHKAGFTKVADKETINSYGSMTYDGIKTYIYAGLKKDDPRVKAAIEWVRRNYAIDSHPGFPSDEKRSQLSGLFYYYLLQARAFDAMGEKTFTTFDGKEHDWAAELGEQLLKVQKDQKMWVNDNPRWWEADPILVTSYVLNTLNAIAKYVK